MFTTKLTLLSPYSELFWSELFFEPENAKCEPEQATEPLVSSHYLVYKPPSQNKEFFISNLSMTINAYSTKYGNTLLMGDLNLTIENKHLEELLSVLNIKSLISYPTCFQSINSTCIDLILTSQEDLFSNFNTCEVGISDHRHLVSTMLSKKISKGSTKTLFYRDYEKF